MARFQTLELVLEPQKLEEGYLLRLKSPLESPSLPDMAERLGTYIAKYGSGTLILDLTHCPSVCASGWGLILFAHQQVKKLGGQFILTGLNGTVEAPGPARSNRKNRVTAELGSVLESFEALDLGRSITSFPTVSATLKSAPKTKPIKLWDSIRIPHWSLQN